AQGRFRDTVEGLAAEASIDVRNASVSLMVPSDRRPPVLGRLSLKLEARGAGRSPAALVGGLSGGGTLTLERAELASLNPLAIDAAIDAADRGLAIDRERVGRFVTLALETARLNVPLIDGTIAVNSGQVRLNSPVTPAQSADAVIGVAYDMSDDLLDIRITLIGSPKADAPNGQRPELGITLKGPIAAPKRTVEVATLVEWLTMRAVNREAKRLEAIETTTSSIPAAPPAPATLAPAMPAAPAPVPATPGPVAPGPVTSAPVAPAPAAPIVRQAPSPPRPASLPPAAAPP